MIYRIKKLLYAILPTAWYLASMQRGFFLLFDLGLLRKDSRFKFHYAIQKLIKNEDVVLDIGANLGYFSKLFARKNRQGKLIAIEPIPPFYKRLNRILSSFSQVEILNVALGAEKGKLHMAMPVQEGVIRTGLPHVIEEESLSQFPDAIEVPVIDAKGFFKELKHLNYIKCDIEGYEWVVFSGIQEEINRLRPLVQIEISELHVAEFLQYFSQIDYVQCGLYERKLKEEKGKQAETSDYLFIPKEKKEEIFNTFNA